MWYDRSGEGRVLRLVGLSILLFDDERSDVVPGLLVVFGVGSVAVRELQTRLYNVRGKLKTLLSSLRPLYFPINLNSLHILPSASNLWMMTILNMEIALVKILFYFFNNVLKLAFSLFIILCP